MFLIGGARSGKSSLALRLADESGAPVVFIATAEARDDEMTERIGRHKAERPTEWQTVEETLRLSEAIASASLESCVIVDCLRSGSRTMLEQDREVETAAQEAAEAAARRTALTIAV